MSELVLPPLLAGPRSQAPLAAPGRRWALAAVAGTHLLLLWAALQAPAVRDAVRQIMPVTVFLLTPPQAPPAADTPAALALPHRAVALPAPPALPIPVLAAAPPQLAAPMAGAEPAISQAAAAPAAAPARVTASVEEPPARPVEAMPVATLPTPTPAATLAPPRKVVSAQAVQYLLEPPVELPRASRRAGEHGVVWLRVVVSALGLPVQVTLARSSGYSRLDEQALAAMRQARFRPHTEDGRAVEVEVTAPIEYPLA